MNVSEFLAECGDVLDDPDGEMFPPETLVRNGDRQLRGLYRTLVESNKQYSNFSMAVQSTAATEPINNVWDYRLPLWVMAVVRVWLRTGSPASMPSFSLYQWAAGSAEIGMEVPKTNTPLTPTWSWQGSNTLRLTHFPSAQNLVLEVVARPSRMVKSLIDTANASASKFYLAAQPNYGTLEQEVGAYVNTDFQVTGTANANATQIGEIRRCIYSDGANLLLGARTYEVSLDSAFSAVLAQGDTIETVLALPDDHTRVLVLRTARACFQQKGNLKALQAIQGELLEEEVKFREYATPPRDAAGPSNWKRRSPFELRRPTSLYPYGYPFYGNL